MIIKSPEKHLTDQEFFTFIKFFDIVICQKGVDDDEDSDSFRLSDICVGDDEMGTIFNRIFMSAQLLNMTVDIHRGYNFIEESNNATEQAGKEPEREKLLKIIKKIKSGKSGIKVRDIASVSWVWYGLYDHVRFTPSDCKIPKDIETIFRTEIDKYLDNFINGRLAIKKKNYFNFKTQKNALIKLIEDGKKIVLYGNNFIISGKIDDQCVFEKLPDFCLIHTVYALQKLGYLRVVNVWEEIKREKSFSDRIRSINANIILEEIFIDEINNKYKKDNPTNILESFDAKRGVLKFAGKEIELSKKGKETDAVLLLKTLLKEETTDWKHSDEILIDWGYNEDDLKDAPKNKIYFAGQKVNTAVALKTQIEDFVECNTSKARINPKYRKVYE